MQEDEYQLEYFFENGFEQKTCSKCGSVYWTRDPDRTTCGDAPCDHYSFIGAPVFKKEFNLSQMREKFLSFFEEREHTRLARYPVIARWRDDIYLTIASIADFQPFVTSGMVPPPANPLTISQPCIRLPDLDSVGRSGRHLTNFEMMAHHAFNNPQKEIYWKNETVAYCDALLTDLGADPKAVTYKEEPWAGGGNAGPCVEVLIGGLEVATLVFMDLKQQKGGDIMIKGDSYVKMDNYIVDTGYGLERFVWASKGSPTIYDAVFPEIVSKLMEMAGVEHKLDDLEYANILAQNAKLAGMMDITGHANLMELRRKVADEIGIPVEKLQKIMDPVERVYAIADHSRCLAFMFGDGIIPSNVKAGYLARLVLRRTLRLMAEASMDVPLSDIVTMQIDNMSEYPEFRERLGTIVEILNREEEKYADTLERGRRLVAKTARHYMDKGEQFPLDEVIQMYDTHGIPPEITAEVAKEIGLRIDLPDTFYSLVAESHSRAEEKEEVEAVIPGIEGLPDTEKSYYYQPEELEFQAKVVTVIDGNIILDRTQFYPEGGGQPHDHGIITKSNSIYHVVDVQIEQGVILHTVTEDKIDLEPGDIVDGSVDSERRMAHMRHHTATHLVNDAAKKVLGNHIWQAGAQKSAERARLDLSHFKRITNDELKEIEMIANKSVMANIPVEITWMDRTEAEQKFGFVLYQGGVPPGKHIRVLKVGDDVEACGGTHVSNTGLIGPIKILKTERIQDGVERLEYAAGEAAVKHWQELDDLLHLSADELKVAPEHLPETTGRFFSEWKEFKKENARLKEELALVRAVSFISEAIEIKGVKVVKKNFIGADADELVKLASELTEDPDVVALLGSNLEGAKIVAACGDLTLIKGANSGDFVREMSKVVGGGGGGRPELAQGGGPDAGKIDEALERGVEMLRESLT
ncbi:MAG: Alanine--tRNA ligase [Candidatus Methanocomedens sp.]|nr:MAG: Alanine--tRNA ligase [ANME-2 cluster archaeon]